MNMDENREFLYVLMMAFLLALFGYTMHSTGSLANVSTITPVSVQQVHALEL